MQSIDNVWGKGFWAAKKNNSSPLPQFTALIIFTPLTLFWQSMKTKNSWFRNQLRGSRLLSWASPLVQSNWGSTEKGTLQATKSWRGRIKKIFSPFNSKDYTQLEGGSMASLHLQLQFIKGLAWPLWARLRLLKTKQVLPFFTSY